MKKSLIPTTALSAMIACSVASQATAQSYPTRPIKMVVPFAPGGPTDTLARIISEAMRPTLGQPIVIENVAGAAGTIGVGRIATAEPDGYSIGIGAWNTHVVNAATYSLSYDTFRDFSPIALVANNAHMIVSRSGIPAKDLGSLTTWIKSNSAKATAGTAGIGSSSHVSAVFFQQATQTKFALVPYRGVAPAALDLLSGQIDLMFDQVSNTIQHVQAGKITAYAVAARSRLAIAPNVPTTDEAGLPGFYISVWHALWAPKGTSPQIVARLNAAVQAALSSSALKAQFDKLGQEIPPAPAQSSAALAEFHRAELAKWVPIIKAAGIKAE